MVLNLNVYMYAYHGYSLYEDVKERNFAPTCYKGAYKYMYIRKDETEKI